MKIETVEKRAGGKAPAEVEGAPQPGEPPRAKYERLLARCKGLPPTPTAVAYPCDQVSLEGALEAELRPDAIAELGAGVALFMGFSKIAVALGGLPDEIPVHEQPTPDVPQ